MFLPTNLNLNNKYFFINFLRFVFSHYDYILFFNILKQSNAYFFPIRMLRFTSSLNICMLNSKIVRSLIKKTVNINFLAGTHLVLYTNDLKDIVNLLSTIKSQFANFIPFALLFRNYFISLNTLSLEQFLLLEKNTNTFLIFFIIFYLNLILFRQIFSVFVALGNPALRLIKS